MDSKLKFNPNFILWLQSELKRLGGVFGDCDDDDSFRDYYGYLYTMQVYDRAQQFKSINVFISIDIRT